MSRIGISIIRTAIFTFILSALGIGMGISSMQAQNFDHEEHPKLDFNFISLELDLGLQPQNLRIDGAAKYEVEANISGADTLTLYASHIDISNVSVDGESADFSLHNDSLFVPLDDSAEAGQRYNLNIRYSGAPEFGLLKNAHGTAWTSQLPKAQRHWLPIVDNPNVAFKSTFNISVPSDYQVWASGQKTGEDSVSAEVMTYSFSSDKEISASSLAFGVGELSSSSVEYKTGNINLAVEESFTDSLNTDQILQSAQDYLEDISARLELDYPYQALNIVVMEDHSWETKSWGASTVFLYDNRGNLQEQLLRGILGQWFGIYQRESQWSQADAITLYQTMLANEISGSASKLAVTDQPETSVSTVYGNFGPKRWNQWQDTMSSWQSPTVRALISDSASVVINELPPIVSWSDYANYWYQETGQPLFEMPQFSVDEEQDKDPIANQDSDSIAYEVFYSLNEAEGQLKLRFSATQGVINELTSLTAYEMYPNKTDTAEVTFTGAQDSVMLQVDPTISTLKLNTAEHPKLVLDEYKPVPFLLYELRNGESVQQRVEAARKLGHHNENPDLQLAVQDVMDGELEPEVRAALLSSLADITQGAAGTEQQFLDALESDSRKIRNAALMGLQNYKGNASVTKKIESLAQNADDFDMFKKATKILMTIASEKQFENFVTTLTQNTFGERSFFAIQQLANMGQVEQAVKRASLFIGDEYSYGSRRRALGILMQYNDSSSDWLSRAENLLNDSDPRIRYLTVEGLERNLNSEITEFLSNYIPDEYDARVYYKTKQLLN